MKVLNLTQHNATPDQIADGLVDLTPEQATAVRAMLTFTALPTEHDIISRAAGIAAFAVRLIAEKEEAGVQIDAVMIGGAPYLMNPLEHKLGMQGIKAVYAFSERRSVDIQQPDGTVRKVAEFAHLGWIPAAQF